MVASRWERISFDARKSSRVHRLRQDAKGRNIPVSMLRETRGDPCKKGTQTHKTDPSSATSVKENHRKTIG